MTTHAYPEARLAGQPLVASSTARWTLRPGVEPVVEEVDLLPSAWSALAPFLGAPVFVNLSVAGKLFEKLLVVREDPAANPHIFRVLVADRRYLWKYRHVHARFNLRRRVGVGRRRAWDVREPTIDPLVPELAWKKWTLAPDGRPWKAADALRHVMALVDPAAEVRVSGDFAALRVPIEDLEIDDAGPQAVARLLAALPGSQLAVDPDGAVRFYFTPSGEEASVRKLLEPEVVAGGQTVKVFDTLDRPSAVRVKFSYQVELRFDFVETSQAAQAAAGAELRRRRGALDVTPRRLENVAQVPDHELTVGSGDAARTVAQNTWLSFEELWGAWGTAPGTVGAGIYGAVRFAFGVPDLGLWSALDTWGRFDPNGVADATIRNWTARVHAIQRHYRQTFRLPRDWMDRIHELMDYLVATIDRVYGSRAPAVAFGDHAYRPSQKGFFLTDEPQKFYAINVNGYPGENVAITDAFKPSPAAVSVVDSDQGIVRLDYLASPFGDQETLFPSKITGVPTRQPDQHRRQPIAWNCTADETGQVLPRLTEDHRVAVILSCFPALTELYEVVVKPEDVKALLPDSVKALIGDTSRGPELDVRVGPGVEVARVRWVDSQDAYDAIESIFYPEKLDALRKVDPRHAFLTLHDLVQPFVINDRPQSEISNEQAASLPAIARAVAASVWTRWAVRTVGAATGAINPALVPLGSTDELTHAINPDGTQVTAASFPAAVDTLSMFAFLDASTRRILMRTLDGNL